MTKADEIRGLRRGVGVWSVGAYSFRSLLCSLYLKMVKGD